MDRIFQREQKDTQGTQGETVIFITKDLALNRKAREQFLMKLADGNVSTYKELKRASIKELLLLIENKVTTDGGQSSSTVSGGRSAGVKRS